jgi:D-psicose/D-tagatose/L-ribulose 3-epimerase
MKYGINTLLWSPSFELEHLPALSRVKQWGFDGIEITRRAIDAFPARVIREAARNEGLDLTFCSALPDGFSLVAEDEDTRARALEYVERGIEIAAELGSPVFAGPFLSTEEETPETWRRAVEALQILTPELRACDVTLALEPRNRFQSTFLRTASDASRLCHAVHDPYIGVTFDTFHANIEEDSLSGSLLSLGQWLAHVHAGENQRGMPGSGHIDWREILGSLQESHYDGWIVIEAAAGDPGAGLDFLKRIAVARDNAYA